MKRNIIALILCMVLFGCVTTSTLKLDPQTLAGQEKVSKEGVSTVVSKKDVLVSVRPSSDTYSSVERPKLVVSVYCTEGSFTFSPENVQVFVDGNPHHVFTYRELVDDIKEKERMEKDKAEKMRKAQYMNTGASGASASVSNNQYTANLNEIERKTYDALKELEITALKSITVQPGKQCGGCITIEKIPDPTLSHEIKVIVKANGETHEFLLNQVEA